MEKRLRGFATWPVEERIANAAKVGKVAHAKGTAHRWTSAEASVAGKIGGKAKKKI
jgi:uncharacterized protein